MEKLQYQSPELTEYGSVDELTQTDVGPGNDARQVSGPVI